MANILNIEELASKIEERRYHEPKESEGEKSLEVSEDGQRKKALEIPIWQKANLTLEEAAAYTGIGINRLRILTNEHEYLAIFIGRKRLIKRRKLDEYLDRASVI